MESALTLSTLSAEAGAPDFAFAAYETAVYALLGRQELILRYENGLAGWSDFIHAAPRPGIINPALVASRTDAIEDGYWMRVIDPTGETIAIIAGRLLSDVGTGMIDWMRAGHLWPEFHGRMRLIDEPGPRGRIAYTAGLWVHPAYRGVGLSWLLPRWNHVYAMRRWETDYSIGMVGRPLYERGVSVNYGAQDVIVVGEIPYNSDSSYVEFRLLVNSRAFLLRRSWEDTLRTWDKGQKKAGDLAAYAPRVKGNN